MRSRHWGRNYGHVARCKSRHTVREFDRVIRCTRPPGHHGDHTGTMPMWPNVRAAGHTEPIDYTWPEQGRPMTRPVYVVEGWDGHDVVGWRTYVRPMAAFRYAQHLTIDRGADIVWFYVAGEAVGYFDGMWFRRTRGHDVLEAAIARVESGE